jgi:hypothetical protein
VTSFEKLCFEKEEGYSANDEIHSLLATSSTVPNLSDPALRRSHSSMAFALSTDFDVGYRHRSIAGSHTGAHGRTRLTCKAHEYRLGAQRAHSCRDVLTLR